MLQVRWNLKPTTTKDKKTLAATFNPITERFKAHRDFDLHAHEIAVANKKAAGGGRGKDKSSADTFQQRSKSKVAKLSHQDSVSSMADSVSSSETATDIHSSGSSDIGILDFDGCDELDYDLDLQACFPLDG